jgi:release factor glutamine methyltransferase
MKMPSKSGGKPVGTVLSDLISRLGNKSETPVLDARTLLAHVMNRTCSWVLAHPEGSMTSRQAAELDAVLARLENGDPLPYILGRWEFFGLKFEVTPDVLIPRPETELLVERAIGWLKAHPDQRYAADVGTGSGCIGIALAASVLDLKVMASDISSEALKMARRNAVNNGVDKRVDLLCCDLFPSENEYNLIVANLPYIPTKTLHMLPIFGREPTLALDGGIDGLDQIRHFLSAAPDRLFPGGLLLMEIEASEGPAAVSLACDIFSEAEIHLHKDLAGRDRVMEIQV